MILGLNDTEQGYLYMLSNSIIYFVKIEKKHFSVRCIFISYCNSMVILGLEPLDLETNVKLINLVPKEAQFDVE